MGGLRSLRSSLVALSWILLLFTLSSARILPRRSLNELQHANGEEARIGPSETQVGPSDSGIDVNRPSVSIIVLILRQKCQQLKDKGVSPLPHYCWFVMERNRGPLINVAETNRDYDRYRQSVPRQERVQNLLRVVQQSRARSQHRSHENTRQQRFANMV